MSSVEPVLLYYSGGVVNVGSILVNATEFTFNRDKNVQAVPDTRSPQYDITTGWGLGQNQRISDFLTITKKYVIDGFLLTDEQNTYKQKAGKIGSMVDGGGFAFMNWGDFLTAQQVMITNYRLSQNYNQAAGSFYGIHIELLAGSDSFS